MAPEPPHILQVTPAFFASDGVIGGGERLALYIDQALRVAAASAGVAITTSLLSLSGTSPLGGNKDHRQALAGRVWEAGSLHADALLARLRPAAVVYVHQCMTEVGLFAAAHARLLGKRVYGSDAGAGEASVLASNRGAIRVYDAVHALSAFGGTAFQGFPVPVHLLPGPIDTLLHRPPEAPRRDRRLILSIGRILPHKGFERIIRALPDGVALRIIGTPYDAAYVDFLQDSARGRDVTFDTDLDDEAVRAMLHRAGCYVQASTHLDHQGQFHGKPELLGLAALEAIASGAPTLVSDAGGLGELGSLPGCQVFHDDAELADQLRQVLSFKAPQAAPQAMHDAVTARHGLQSIGQGLLTMMGIETPCVS